MLPPYTTGRVLDSLLFTRAVHTIRLYCKNYTNNLNMTAASERNDCSASISRAL